MINRNIKCVLALLLLILGGSALARAENAHGVSRPNFLWLVSEDNAKHFLQLYNDAGAPMPNIEKLAAQGLVFDNAYSNSAVCSVARSTLATGVYAPKIGTQFHRAAQKVVLKKGIQTINEMLKQAGYYTSNNAKKDYNFSEPQGHWDDSSLSATWKNRDPDQPFFHMQTWQDTHEHVLHFAADEIPSAATTATPPLGQPATLFPVYPDIPAFQYTHAYYLQQHQILDNKIGQTLDALRADGLLEDTFIFYFGDHGGALPASKGTIYDRGLNIPLVVRIPKNYQHLLHSDFSAPNNVRVKGVVSFIDFAPTLLELAGLEKPPQQDGESFLSNTMSLAELNSRDTTFSYADRFDEKMDFNRAIRVGRYKYIRSYFPYYPHALFNDYRERQVAAKQWKALYRAGKTNEIQSAFFRPRAPERLYDIAADPHETINLASKAQYQNLLTSLRDQLNDTLKGMPDLSFIPESVLVNNKVTTTQEAEQARKKHIAKLLDIANLQYQNYSDSKTYLTQYINSQDALSRYWALIVLSSFAEKAAAFLPLVKQIAAQDPNNLVRARAIEFLAILGEQNTASQLIALLQKTTSDLEKLEILNIATYLHDVHGLLFDIQDSELTTAGQIDKNLVDYWFSSRQAHLSSQNTLIQHQ
ncbi:sulfatase-like hydrolase/transferase [Paraglaciecola chathamensis]|uniref:Sulfatase N-terminal domain-containing protein n=1 Tax=Paraglaciecola agarilytica NO2 TaxID=1125747 RepID=A0ABQ0IC04_9ALTE|nr:sulfatase-like hydrolase/transferase [Paraglaciecola agarilytica]GAC06922.1 hypothetical protein GAGA_4089 [Paraglaciecola agarilytica NO2]